MSADKNDDRSSGSTMPPSGDLSMRPALAHQIYALIGFAWPAFGFIFLIMLCSNFWFGMSIPVWWLFPVVCLLALLLGHLVAITLESHATTRALYFFRRGMPLIFYRRFALIQHADIAGAASVDTSDKNSGPEQPAIIFGTKRILLAVVDELHLTFLGVLEIRTFATSGKVIINPAESLDRPANKPDLLARVPIGVLTLSDQKRLVQAFRDGRPDLKVNKRLDERLLSPIVKGQAFVSSIGAVILLYALFDVSYATFTWLEMLKDYYGSQMCMRLPDKAQTFLERYPGAKDSFAARAFYQEAEQLRNHPFAFSWAYRALFANGNSAAQLLAIKADTLYWLKEKDQAIKVLQDALLLKPSGYKIQLQLVRMLAAEGKTDDARRILAIILEKHKDALMPRIYDYALLSPGSAAADKLYKQYLDELDQEVFGDEPSWPPGRESPLMEMWRRDDLQFLVPYFKATQPPTRKP